VQCHWNWERSSGPAVPVRRQSSSGAVLVFVCWLKTEEWLVVFTFQWHMIDHCIVS
jgi:hypothetical protein